MDCRLPGSSVHGISQARILECVAISFSRGSSRPRDLTWVSCIAGRCFNLWATREAQTYSKVNLKMQSNIYCVLSHFSHIELYAVLRLQPARLLRLWDSLGKNTGVAISFSGESSWPRDQTLVFYIYLHWEVGSLSLAPPGNPQYILGVVKYCLIPLIWGTQNTEIPRVSVYTGRCQGPGDVVEREMGLST